MRPILYWMIGLCFAIDAGLFFYKWKIFRRRKSDILQFSKDFLLGVSYIMYAMTEDTWMEKTALKLTLENSFDILLWFLLAGSIIWQLWETIKTRRQDGTL